MKGRSRTVISGRGRRAAMLWRTGTTAVAIATAVAFGVVLGPVQAAEAANTTVSTAAELIQAITNADSSIVLGADISAAPSITAPAGAAIILDVAGHALNTSESVVAGVTIPLGASLTIEDTVGGGSFTAIGGSGSLGLSG
ncbi:MAG: hypothetical protein EPN48_05030 [Microbacteriaceae bacterium]|nr:MAG: hypothetical protein EPN48_05030 [Microbacteriaceae bacterium]